MLVNNRKNNGLLFIRSKDVFIGGVKTGVTGYTSIVVNESVIP